MQDEPLVTVITVTRNRAKLLGRCIDSVLGQTYKNIEHIIVDGASEDETDDVIKSYNDERLRYIKMDYNMPPVQSFHYGVSLAKGKYVTFLDSDDEYLPSKIEKQVNLIESLPEDYGMVYCWMTYFDSANNNAICRIHKVELRGFVPAEAVEKPTVSGTPTFLFKTEVFKDIGGWNLDNPLPTDWELGARCCVKYKVDYVPESLVNVYVNHIYERTTDVIHNKKSDLFTKRVAMHLFMLDEFKDVFDKHPSRRGHHYSRISYFSYKSGKYKDAILYFVKYLGTKFNL